MKTIWNRKISISEIRDIWKVDFPVGSKILSVINQNEYLVVYALVDDIPKLKLEMIELKIAGTGSPADHIKKSEFIGTVQFQDGRLVIHVFGPKESK
jgi:hypothetical protein